MWLLFPTPPSLQLYAEAEATAQQRLADAEQAVEAARREAATADERATAAEVAKIQLSMRLAELDSREPGAGKSSGGGVEDGEERFAAAVQAKRVATAEEQAAALQKELEAANEQLRKYEWQVQPKP